MKQTQDLTKPTKTSSVANTQICEARRIIEKVMSENLNKPMTSPNLAAIVGCPRHQVRNVIMRLMRSNPGKVREVGRNEKNQPLYVWHTSKIKSIGSKAMEKDHSIAPARTWVNGAMPPADPAYWRNLFGQAPR